MTKERAVLRLAEECSRAEYCSGDLKRKMDRWGMPEDEQNAVIAYLRKGKYIDDGRFCRFYCNDKLRFNKWGRVKLRLSLKMKNLDKEAVEEGIASIDGELYTEVLLGLLRGKARSLSRNDKYERDMKLMRFAAGHGFTAEEIRECLGRL